MPTIRHAFHSSNLADLILDRRLFVTGSRNYTSELSVKSRTEELILNVDKVCRQNA
jgi:hypothetical protein